MAKVLFRSILHEYHEERVARFCMNWFEKVQAQQDNVDNGRLQVVV